MDRRLLSKLSTKSSKVTPRESRFNEKLHSAVRDVFYRDDNSTSFPEKRDFKKVKSRRFQSWLFNDFLKNLYLKFLPKKPEQTIPFPTFAPLTTAHFKLVKFTLRSSCLCVKHQNILLKLKVVNSKGITTFSNSNVFIKHYDTNSITKKINKSCERAVTYEVWKKTWLLK